MSGAVKRTLCEIILAAGLFGCTTPATAPEEYIEIITEEVLQHEIDYFNNKQYNTLIDLITKRKARTETENRISAEQYRNLGIPQPIEVKISAAERTMAALGYAMLGDYPNARVEFTLLMNDFKSHPVLTVRAMERLQKFYEGEQYRKAESNAIAGTLFYPEMNAVVGFLKFARKDYEGARKYFKAAIPNFTESTVQEYRRAFAELLLNAAKKENNDAVILEYAHIIQSVFSVQGKKEEN